jgi:hypothetical protein
MASVVRSHSPSFYSHVVPFSRALLKLGITLKFQVIM